jgi:hypothetical protein
MSTPIPYRFWLHTSGRTASMGGAVPWVTPSDEANWTAQEQGWTVRHPDGTTGLGRKPFATKEEAQTWCDAHPRFPGMSQD